MSRVYTDKIIRDVAIGTAAYINSFQRALASTRISFEAPPTFGGSLLDFVLNVFGSSDPYIAEEVAITASWSISDGSQWLGTDFGSSGNKSVRTHLIPTAFKASWPPPAVWAQTVDWHPLTQDNPRHRHFGRYRSRRSRQQAEAG